MIDRHSTADVGAEAIKRADSLKISLYKNDDGSVSSSFELHGSAIVDDSSDDEGGATTVDRQAGLVFLRQLMNAFENH